MTTQSFPGCGLNNTHTLITIDRLGCFSSQLAMRRKIMSVFIVLVNLEEIVLNFFLIGAVGFWSIGHQLILRVF